MNIISKLSPKKRVRLGIVFLVLGVILYFILKKYNAGFFTGFLTGMFVALGAGLIITRHKTFF